MITAKPLKIKHLQAKAVSKAVSPAEPEDTRNISEAYSDDKFTRQATLSPFEVKPSKYVYIKGKLLQRVILFIVKNTGGIDSYHIKDLVLEFCRLHNFKFTGNVSATLHQLWKEEKIKRIEFEDKYYYFPLEF